MGWISVSVSVKRQRLQRFYLYAMYIGKSEKNENSNMYEGSRNFETFPTKNFDPVAQNVFK